MATRQILQEFIFAVKMVGGNLVKAEVKGLNEAFESVNKTTGMTTITTNKLKESGDGVAGTISRKVVPSVKKFKFEFLGLMFAGMAIQQLFTGLLQPALNTAQVFDILGTILEITLLPIVLLLLPPLLGILDVVSGLPEEVKLAIGVFVLLGAAIGIVLFFASQIVLALASWGLAAATAGSVIAGLTAFLGTFATFIAIWAVPIILVLALLALAFSTNGDAIMAALDGVLKVVFDIFGDVIKIFEGVIDFIVGVFTLDADKAMGGLTKIFEGAVGLIINLFLNLPMAILNVFAQILIGLGKWLIGLPGFIISFGGKIMAAFLGLIPEPIRSWITGGISATAGFVGNIASGISNSLSGFIPGLQEGGIVTRPTLAMVGEGGPEAIIPLRGGGGAGTGDVTMFVTNHVSAKIENDMDIRNLAERLNEESYNDMRRRREL